MFWSRQVARTAGASYRVSNRAPWSPAQLFVAVAGLVFIVIGGVALARSGVNFHNIPLTRVEVAGLWFTSLSALITLIAGVIMLVGGIDPDAAKATTWFFGIVLIAFGLIVAISPQSFTNMWGYTAANGVFYVVTGAILVLAGGLSPVFYSRREVVSEQQIVDDQGIPPAAAPPAPAPRSRVVRDDHVVGL
jgi:hypothetical protein